MELYQLRSFVAVAEEAHVGRAAVRLHLSQPTVSRQIAVLERHLGVPLFTRGHRGLTLTPAGKTFLDGARGILRAVDAATRDVWRASRGEVGTLRVGFVQSATYGVVPRLVGRFRAAFPDVWLDLRPMTTLRQIAALRAGDLDVGVLRPGQPAGGWWPDVRTVEVSRDPFVVALPAGHRLAAGAAVPLVELADEAFVLYPAEAGSTGHDSILELCAGAGFVPRVVHAGQDAQTIVALVGAGLGVSLLLTPGPPVDPGLVVYRPLAGDSPVWVMALAWLVGNQSPVLAHFVDPVFQLATT
jgi:DNA-binding transcriptional LysR family regulator